MITAEAIKDANSRVSRIEIGKGDKKKYYTCVPARVMAYREMCATGSITTEIVSMTDKDITVKATVTDEDGKVLGTGYAHEDKDATFINKTSFVENAETSAVGRALGMLGIGSDEQMASAEELANAINQQTNGDWEKRLREMAFIYENINPDNWEKICKIYKVGSIADMSLAQLINYHGQYDAQKAKNESVS